MKTKYSIYGPIYRPIYGHIACIFICGKCVAGIEEEPKFRVVRKVLGPAGKNMKDIAEQTGDAFIPILLLYLYNLQTSLQKFCLRVLFAWNSSPS